MIQDLKFAIRMLIQKPAFSVVIVLTLALGIGANTALFTIVDAVLIQPLPYRDSNQIVQLFSTSPDEGKDPAIKTISFPDFLDYQKSGVFEEICVIDYGRCAISGGSHPEQLFVARVSANLFHLFGFVPAHGRGFRADEDRQGGAPVVVLSHRLWQERFGGDQKVIGRAVSLDQGLFTVIGVLPRDFRLPVELDGEYQVDLLMPVTPTAFQRTRGIRRFEAYGRLRSEASIENAQRKMDLLAKRLQQEYADTNRDIGVGIARLQELTVRGSRTVLFLLFGAVGFILLIACSNVANMMMGRATTRRSEIAIRVALGAGRKRIIRQLLTESVLLAVSGGALGVLFALWGVDTFVSFYPGGMPRLREAGINFHVLCFTLIVSTVTGVIFGLVPAWQSSKLAPVDAMKEKSQFTSGNRARKALVVCEVALAVVLSIGAALLLKSFSLLMGVDTGVNIQRTLTMRISLPKAQYPEKNQAKDFYQRMLDRLKAQPGIQAAGVVNILPLGGGYSCDTFTRDDRPAEPGKEPCAEYRSITPGYLNAIGIRLVKGRAITDQDTDSSEPVAMINEEMARKYWPDRDPVGMKVTSDTGLHISRRIVGVVTSVKHFGPGSDAAPELYIPYAQDPWPQTMTLVLETIGDPESLIASAQKEIWALDRNLPVAEIFTMEDLLSRSVAQPRFRTVLLGIFASVALLLSMVGIYGVVTYSTERRTHEIGIRTALGALPRDILTLIFRDGMALTLIGIGTGLILATGISRMLSGFLFATPPIDPITYICVSLFLAAVALFACMLPAIRAARVDPVQALKYE